MNSQRAAWRATVGTTIALQWAVVAMLAGAAWLVGGSNAALSLGMGGASVALPNTALAAWLTLRVMRGGAGAAAMLGGEMVKLVLTVTLLVIAVKANPGVSWLALIVGVVVALKAQWLALWFTRNIRVETGTHGG